VFTTSAVFALAEHSNLSNNLTAVCFISIILGFVLTWFSGYISK
jgi:hypothetical protein